MAVTDLTGTTWELNQNGVDVSTLYTWNVNYDVTGGSFADSYTVLAIVWNDRIPEPQFTLSGLISGLSPFAGNSWSYEGTFTFTGGTDVTNSNLIAWLESNATQIIDEPIVDADCKIMTMLPFNVYGETIESGGSSAAMIEFTIGGTTYQAEDGMSWGDWVESEYNPGEFFIANYNEVYYQNMHNSVYLDRITGVYSNDTIIEGFSYRIVGGGSN